MKMKRRNVLREMILTLMLLLATGTLQAQIVEFNGIDVGDHSLVRAIDDTSYLLCSFDLSNDSKLVYYNQTSGIVKELPLLLGIRINDMRIGRNDDVYFCGTDGINNGVVGMFKVHDAFFSGGPVYCIIIGGYLNDEVHPVSFNRMKLFESGGHTCMALVADGLQDPNLQLPRTMVFSSYFDGTNWHLYYDANKNNDIKYTDIAVLDDVIVAAGTDPSGAQCYMKTYRHSYDFPIQPCNPYHAYTIDHPTAIDKVLATHYSGNIAAFAQYEKNGSTLLYQVSFTVPSGTPVSPAATWSTDPASPHIPLWDLQELETSRSMKTYLLQKTTHTAAAGLKDWLLEFSYASGVSSILSTPFDHKEHSMDLAHTTQHPVLSGLDSHLIMTGPIVNMDPQPCAPRLSLRTTSFTLPIRVVEIDESGHRASRPSSAIVRPVAWGSSLIICN